MWAEPNVMRYLSQSGPPMAGHEAWRAFTGQGGHWSLRGFGMFAVMERASGDLVGIVGPWLPEGWPPNRGGLHVVRRQQSEQKGPSYQAANQR